MIRSKKTSVMWDNSPAREASLGSDDGLGVIAGDRLSASNFSELALTTSERDLDQKKSRIRAAAFQMVGNYLSSRELVTLAQTSKEIKEYQSALRRERKSLSDELPPLIGHWRLSATGLPIPGEVFSQIADLFARSEAYSDHAVQNKILSAFQELSTKDKTTAFVEILKSRKKSAGTDCFDDIIQAIPNMEVNVWMTTVLDKKPDPRILCFVASMLGELPESERAGTFERILEQPVDFSVVVALMTMFVKLPGEKRSDSFALILKKTPCAIVRHGAQAIFDKSAKRDEVSKLKTLFEFTNDRSFREKLACAIRYMPDKAKLGAFRIALELVGDQCLLRDMAWELQLVPDEEQEALFMAILSRTPDRDGLELLVHMIGFLPALQKGAIFDAIIANTADSDVLQKLMSHMPLLSVDAAESAFQAIRAKTSDPAF